MKLGTLALTILATATLLTACGRDNADSHTGDGADHSTHATAATTAGGPAALTLDDGHKWPMDDHTRTVFLKMAASFPSTAPSSLETAKLQQAGADLQQDLDSLVQGCTMTGAAHDQLHVFLTGYMPAVATLAEAGRKQEAVLVRQYLEQYDDYFE